MDLQEDRSPNADGALTWEPCFDCPGRRQFTAFRKSGPGESPDAKNLCLGLLENLTAADIGLLRHYAAYRLGRIGLGSFPGEDVLQDTFAAVLTGLSREQEGRHPRMTDLENKPAFLRYLKGVVNSMVEAERRKQEHRVVHWPLACNPDAGDVRNGICLTAVVSPENDVELRMFRDEFFKRLKAKAPPGLRHLVDAWEEVFLWAEQIPLQGRRRRVRARLRSLSRQVLQEMNENLAKQTPPTEHAADVESASGGYVRPVRVAVSPAAVRDLKQRYE
jgi:hypothetical protein